MDAFLEGMERAQKSGIDLSRIGSVASFFVSRVDTEVDKRLGKIGTKEAKELLGKAAVANARLAYQHYEEVFPATAGGRWRRREPRPQRPLWASTGVKDPKYPDTMYVADLVAPDTVNTMPEATMDAVYDHGVIEGDTIRGHYADAQRVLDDLKAVGVDYDDVVGTSNAKASRSSRTPGPSSSRPSANSWGRSSDGSSRAAGQSAARPT